MASNPFEDENGRYRVLVNDQGQCSLWPEGIDIPAGWKQAAPAASRAEAIFYIERYWTNLHRRSTADP